MKNLFKLFQVLLLLIISTHLFGQDQTVKFEYIYDAAGNRTSRAVINISQGKSAVRDTINSDDPEEDYSNFIAEHKEAYEKLAMNFDEIKANVYPNPVKEELYLEISGDADYGKVFYEVIDLNGKIVISKKLKSSKTSINFNNMQSGAYILRLFINDNYKEYKIIKE